MQSPSHGAQGIDSKCKTEPTEEGPPTVSIGHPHPDPCVFKSQVQLPERVYDLITKDNLRNFSPLQRTTLVNACQTHMRLLEDGTREGFYLDAGVGKGRTIAALIWENWNHGRRKTLWFSTDPKFKTKAQADLHGVGATCIEVHHLKELSTSKFEGFEDGVVGITYKTFYSRNHESRLEQLVLWFGSKYDGLIVFDEWHNNKGLVSGDAEQSAILPKLVMNLQAQLPQARVVYCSKIANLRYMSRLHPKGDGKDESQESKHHVSEKAIIGEDGLEKCANILKSFSSMEDVADKKRMHEVVSEWISTEASEEFFKIVTLAEQRGQKLDDFDELRKISTGEMTREMLGKNLLAKPADRKGTERNQ